VCFEKRDVFLLCRSRKYGAWSDASILWSEGEREREREREGAKEG
jgi:hypothetical protein